MHRQNVMHCDLKLENILINYDDRDMRVVEVCVADLGSALDLTSKNLKKQ